MRCCRTAQTAKKPTDPPLPHDLLPDPPDHLPPVANAPGASPAAAPPPPGRTRHRIPAPPRIAGSSKSRALPLPTGLPRDQSHHQALAHGPPDPLDAAATPHRPANLVLIRQPCRPSSPTAACRPPPMAPNLPPAFSHSPTQSTAVRGTEAGSYPVHLHAAAVGRRYLIYSLASVREHNRRAPVTSTSVHASSCSASSLSD